jgi:hypothetical protein
VVDANVLIDYLNADLTVLGLLSKAMSPVYVSDAVLENVDGIDRHGCDVLVSLQDSCLAPCFGV